MPSIEEAKRQVKAGLKNHQQHEVDHDAILASLWDEIGNHNEQQDHYVPRRHRDRRPSQEERAKRRTSKFRLKDGSEAAKRKHRSRDEKARKRGKHSSKRHDRPSDEEASAHPFPREPTNPDRSSHENADKAFQESLFDALADDEGAAYWESVYSQPIHVFARPTVPNARGELEEMSDEQYAAYVQTKMWEKSHPHVVLEREKKEKQRKEEEEERTRKREEFVRRKQRAAWERTQNEGARKFAGIDDEYEYVFDYEDRKGSASKRTSGRSMRHEEYRDAWEQYLLDWDALKHELLQTDHAPGQGTGEQADSRLASKRIPWPVLQSKPVIKQNIEDFMRNVPVESGGRSREQLLKVERVRWHPDKVQQRFRGSVDEGTMKIVTGVFQVVDALLEAERKR